MRYILVVSFIVLTTHIGFGQTKNVDDKKSNKGSMYFYWGWNRGWYGKSTMNFNGADYDFTLKKVIAKDRQSKFLLNTYFNPANATIPQYNFRIGYFFKENWDISFGIDHMKYVVQQNQVAEISGYINNSQSIYDGVYKDDKISIVPGFLLFEHTDGLNYANIELRHSDKIIDIGKVKISLKEGVGAGILLPRTNTTLLGKEKYDEFHLSGYGISAVVGINVSFFNNFFIQTEFKGGFIDLPDVRTTISKNDRASHNFFFTQFNIVFGGIIKIKNKS